MDQHLYRPPVFFRPPPCDNFVGRMPWGSPAHPMIKKYRPPFLRPPFGTSPEGLRLLPSHMQAPPMFGPRGSTVPPHLMPPHHNQNRNYRFNSYQEHEMDKGGPQKEFWCETCDRAFNTKDMLTKHNSEHQKCGIDGCKFTAHANVVTKHIEMQHKTGLYDKIRNISTPEDIANWIKERKKNYPTKENIEKQKEQHKECFDRGEKLEQNKSRFNNNRFNNSRNNKNGRFQDRRNKFHDNKRKGSHSNTDSGETQPTPGPSNNHINSKRPFPKGKPVLTQDRNISKKTVVEQKDLENEDNQMHCNLKPFKGTSELIRNDLINDHQIVPVVDDFEIADDEWQELQTDNLNVESKLSVCNALSNLISAYDSSDSESENLLSVPVGAKSKLTKSVESTTKSTIIPESTKASNIVSSVNIPDEVKSNCVNPEVMGVETNLDIDSDGSGPEEIKIVKLDEHCIPQTELLDANNLSASSNKRVRKRKHSTANKETVENKANNNDGVTNKTLKVTPPNVVQKPYYKRKVPKTLLEKLLENDIKTERNMVLQCVNYIVKNNFFEQS